jgi:hypothetical protein
VTLNPKVLTFTLFSPPPFTTTPRPSLSDMSSLFPFFLVHVNAAMVHEGLARVEKRSEKHLSQLLQKLREEEEKARKAHVCLTLHPSSSSFLLIIPSFNSILLVVPLLTFILSSLPLFFLSLIFGNTVMLQMRTKMNTTMFADYLARSKFSPLRESRKKTTTSDPYTY